MLLVYGMSARSKEVQFDVNYCLSLPEQLELDEHRCLQVLNSLVENAVKHTNFGRIQIDIYFQNGTLKTVVTDTGSGICIQT